MIVVNPNVQLQLSSDATALTTTERKDYLPRTLFTINRYSRPSNCFSNSLIILENAA